MVSLAWRQCFTSSNYVAVAGTSIFFCNEHTGTLHFPASLARRRDPVAEFCQRNVGESAVTASRPCQWETFSQCSWLYLFLHLQLNADKENITEDAEPHGKGSRGPWIIRQSLWNDPNEGNENLAEFITEILNSWLLCLCLGPSKRRFWDTDLCARSFFEANPWNYW